MIKRIITIALISVFCSSCYALSDSGIYAMRKTGDVLQILNPIVTYGIATQEMGGAHFMLHFGQSIAFMGAGKYAGTKLRYDAGRRPDSSGYNGMPSGHTTSAWTSAAYVRQYGGKYRYLAVPLYASAAFTGASRVISKRHTVTQVLAAVALSEGVVFINSRFDWAQTHVEIMDGTIFAGIRVRL